MAKTSTRSKILLAAGALLVIPVLILLAELGARIFSPRLDPLHVFVTSPQLRSDTQGEATSGVFEFDPALTWRLRANLPLTWWDFTPVQTNGAHLRMRRQIGPKAGLRIVCLGDSVTFGYRVPVAHERTNPADHDPTEQPYPQLLEDMLRARFPGKPIEVLPLACPGYTSDQGLAWLRRDIAELQPDLVTACFGWNDVRAAGFPDRLTFPTTQAQITVRRIMAHSQLLLHLAKSAQTARAAELLPPQAEPRTSAEEYVAHFAEMNSVAGAHRAWFGVILPVYRDPNAPGEYPENAADPGNPEEAARMSAYRAALRAHAQEKNLPHLLIPELTETNWPGNTQLFGERIHPNAAGHRLLAERVLEFVLPVVEARLR